MFHCYVLRSLKTDRRYAGSCEDLSDRVRRHNSAESKATKHGVSWILIRSESFATRREALVRERFYKTGKGRDDIAQVRRYSYFLSATDRRDVHPDHTRE